MHSMMSANSNNRSSRDNLHAMIRVLAKMKNGMNIIHLNAQSLLKKIDEFRFIFVGSNVDFICVTETWFRSDMPDELAKLDGYYLYRVDRQGHAGGVAIYVRNGIASRIRLVSDPQDNMEYIFISVGRDNKTLLIGNVYRPNKLVRTDELMEKIHEVSMSFNEIIITGDFNSNLLLDNNLISDFNTYGLHSVNSDTPTHYTNTSETLLDLFLVGSVDKVLLYDQLSASCFSRHDIIFLNYNFTMEYEDKTIWYRDFRHVDNENLLTDLLSVEWSAIYHYEDVNEKVRFLEENVIRLYERYVPLKRRVVKSRQQPWITGRVTELISKRNRAYSRWKRFRTERLHDEYRTLRNQVVKEIRENKMSFYGERYNSAVTCRQKWGVIRDIGIGIGKKTGEDANLSKPELDDMNRQFLAINVPFAQGNVYLGGLQTDVNGIDEQFRFRLVDQCDVLESILRIKSNATGVDGIDPNFLKPILPNLLPFITHIFNYILLSSIFPSGWKRAKVIPVPKSNNDFRPIAILPFLSKAFENIVYDQINTFLNRNFLLSDRQSGFRKRRSCTTALIDVVENIRRNINDNHVSFLVLLDHSKAFDSVDHTILASKLTTLFNFDDTAVRFIASYLDRRTQAVYSNGMMSDFLELTRGIPQGSVLGPLLFSLYVNDIASIPDGYDMHIYADDVQLCFSCRTSDTRSYVAWINLQLIAISDWATKNGLKLNPDKTKCIVISRKSIDTLSLPRLALGDKTIEYVQTARNLGVLFDNTLSWNRHIELAIGQIYGMLRTLWSIHQYIPFSVRHAIAHAYLLPKLLYCCEIYAECDYVHKRKLKVVSNDITRFVYSIRRADSISSASRQFYGMEFENFLKFRALTFMHRLIYTHEPKYLYDRLEISRSSRTNCMVPLQSNYLVCDRQFFVYTIRLWNALPINLRNSPNEKNFKLKLKHHLT